MTSVLSTTNPLFSKNQTLTRSIYTDVNKVKGKITDATNLVDATLFNQLTFNNDGTNAELQLQYLGNSVGGIKIVPATSNITNEQTIDNTENNVFTTRKLNITRRRRISALLQDINEEEEEEEIEEENDENNENNTTLATATLQGTITAQKFYSTATLDQIKQDDNNNILVTKEYFNDQLEIEKNDVLTKTEAAETYEPIVDWQSKLAPYVTFDVLTAAVDAVQEDITDVQDRIAIDEEIMDTQGKMISANTTAINDRLTKGDAAATYETQAHVNNTFLTKSSASDTYVTKSTYNNKVSDLEKSIDTKANSSDVYTKSETYTKTETNTLLGDKANSNNVYTKTQIDNSLANKADKDSVYTKTEINTQMKNKANTDDVYTKEQANTLLGGKADLSNVYTKAEIDSALNNKVNNDSVYTKTEIDESLATKANIDDILDKDSIINEFATKADKENTYDKATVDNKIILATNDCVSKTAIVCDSSFTPTNQIYDTAYTYNKIQIDNLLGDKLIWQTHDFTINDVEYYWANEAVWRDGSTIESGSYRQLFQISIPSSMKMLCKRPSFHRLYIRFHIDSGIAFEHPIFGPIICSLALEDSSLVSDEYLSKKYLSFQPEQSFIGSGTLIHDHDTYSEQQEPTSGVSPFVVAISGYLPGYDFDIDTSHNIYYVLRIENYDTKTLPLDKSNINDFRLQFVSLY